MLQIYCGIALVSAFAERSFSVMKKIKTLLRSSMKYNSLNNRMFANIHENMLDNINLRPVADNFAEASETLTIVLGCRNRAAFNN